MKTKHNNWGVHQKNVCLNRNISSYVVLLLCLFLIIYINSNKISIPLRIYYCILNIGIHFLFPYSTFIASNGRREEKNKLFFIPDQKPYVGYIFLTFFISFYFYLKIIRRGDFFYIFLWYCLWRRNWGEKLMNRNWYVNSLYFACFSTLCYLLNVFIFIKGVLKYIYRHRKTREFWMEKFE